MTERHARAAEERGVSVLDLDDGMALLQVLLPATLGHGIGDRVRQQARAIRDAAIAELARRVAETAATETATAGPEIDDTRTLSQISAHLVADKILTGAPATAPIAERTPGRWAALPRPVAGTRPHGT